MINVLFDMETSDPDDVVTLCFLTSHPLICLRAVTVLLGTNEQIGLVKHILNLANLDIPVGSYQIGSPKACVSNFYYKWFGNFEEQNPDNEGFKLIEETLLNYPDLIILTGAPLKNFSKLNSELKINKWVAQGGFAGQNVVPEAYQLEKFKGMLTCPTFNFNGDPSTALKLLSNENIIEKRLISKNVCHGVIYNQEMHEKFSYFKNNSVGLNLIYNGMSLYLEKNAFGKKFHDPLAACVLIDESVCEFVQVEMFRKKGGWGCNFKENSSTWISIYGNIDKMIQILTTT